MEILSVCSPLSPHSAPSEGDLSTSWLPGPLIFPQDAQSIFLFVRFFFSSRFLPSIPVTTIIFAFGHTLSPLPRIFLPSFSSGYASSFPFQARGQMSSDLCSWHQDLSCGYRGASPCLKGSPVPFPGEDIFLITAVPLCCEAERSQVKSGY